MSAKTKTAPRKTPKAKPSQKMPTLIVDKDAPPPPPRTNSQRYTDAIARFGSVLKAADALGIAPLTIARRCNDITAIPSEAWLALEALEYRRVEGLSAAGESAA